MIKRTAPNFITSEAHLATLDSARSDAFGEIYSLKMLRVKRLAAAMDITEAGTSAPIEMAAKAKPANQLGNCALMSAGTAAFAPKGASDPTGLICAAIAIKPVRASRPSISE